MVGNNGYMVLPEAKKKKIVLSVLEGRVSVSEVSKSSSVARKTIYSWIKRYKKGSLASLYVKGKKHPRAVYPKAYSYINRWVVAHPGWGCRVLSSKLKSKGINLSYVQINQMLNRMGAESFDRRVNYARNFAGPGRNNEDVRIEIVKKAIIEKAPISSLSENYNVARKTIYRWIKKYEAEGAIKDAYVTGTAHPKAIYPKIAQQVLGMVAANPAYSVHTLKKFFPVSSWTIWKILDKNNLNTHNLRLEYSRNASFISEQKISTTGIFGKVRSVFESFTPNLAPAPPPKATSILKTFAISSFFSFITIYGFLSWINIISGGDSFASGVGLVFAGVALAAGMFFFLYSLKYYLVAEILLSFSNRKKKQLDIQNPGMNADVENVHIKNYPFVSVQIPFYNEKNVVERSVTAATNFDYPEYEVILCDDSTDETTDIIKTYQKRYLFKGEELKVTKGDGWTLTEVLVRPGVTLKHLHRTTRTGYKGGALDLALRLADPRTEFVSIFDADFVPYGDSLKLFVRYFKVANDSSENFSQGNIAAVQGYQWHVLNKSENWITRGVRSEYSGSYVIERAGTEIYKGLKQISGSVYMIRKDVLSKIGWGTSITEDFELTLKLYNEGYKVVYTPYIQAPAECVSTLRRLIRQRMRWAEGHSFNVKLMARKLLTNPKLSVTEKLEFTYLMPYYLQAFFFLVGTTCWLISETVFKVRLPFWTELWGWSLLLTNMISLPLLNSVGLFLEESEQKDYTGILSFIALSYIIVPFQAYATIKGFLEKEEGPWFRTPKTGRVTDVFKRGKFYKFISGILPGKSAEPAIETSHDFGASQYLSLATANNRFDSFNIGNKSKKWIGKLVLSCLLIISVTVYHLSNNVSVVMANPDNFYFNAVASTVITGVTAWQFKTSGTLAAKNVATNIRPAANATGWYSFEPNAQVTASSSDNHTPDGKGWIFDTAYGAGVTIPTGTWSFRYSISPQSAGYCGAAVGKIHFNVYKVSVSGGNIDSSTFLFDSSSTTDFYTGSDMEETLTVSPNPSQVDFDDTEKYLYVEVYGNVTTGCAETTSSRRRVNFDIAGTTTHACSTADCNMGTPTVSIPENVIVLIFVAPFIPLALSYWVTKRKVRKHV